jgi:hypothetical protein
MEDQWFTYSEAADKLGVSRQAVRQKAIRGHCARTCGNDGQARVQLPELPYPVRTPSVLAPTNPERVADSQLVDTLKAHIDTLKAELVLSNVPLKGELAHLRDELTQRDALLVTERERADRAVEELFELTSGSPSQKRSSPPSASARIGPRPNLPVWRNSSPMWRRRMQKKSWRHNMPSRHGGGAGGAQRECPAAYPRPGASSGYPAAMWCATRTTKPCLRL